MKSNIEQTSEKIHIAKKPTRKQLGIAGGIVVILLAIIVGLGIYNTPDNRLSRQIDLGQRFLEEQNYEQAVVEFDKAIAIDSMSVKAYLGKVDAYIGLGNIDMVLQTLEEGLEHTGNEQIKDKLVECYLSRAEEHTRKVDYEKALEVYDRLLELDSENTQIQSDVGNCLLKYLDLLMEQGLYDEARALIEKYQDKVDTADLQGTLTRIEELERIEIENIAFIQKVYDLMIEEDWELLRMLDETEEAVLFVERMQNDKYLYFPAENTSQTGIGAGVYKNESNHYFYVGDYVDSIRSGNGTFYETNDYDGYDYFTGEWRDDSPNGQGELTKNYYLYDDELGYSIVTKGNYTNGLSDGNMNCILWQAVNRSFDMSYTAVNGTPEDITDAVHRADVYSWIDNNIYAYDSDFDRSWNLHLNSEDDRIGVFGFELIHEKSWQDIYIGYINEKRYNSSSYADPEGYSYSLVNIDGDDVPELYINYGTTADGSVLCSIYNGLIIEQWLWTYGLEYIEGQNLFMDSGGHMDYYYDKIYSIRDGEFVLLCEGECGALDNPYAQLDENGNRIYDYSSNGERVSSSEEYNSLLNEVYNTQESIDLLEEYAANNYEGDEFSTYEEIIEAINNY